MSAPQPIKPVTISGWYEHSDGTVGYYSWHVAGGVSYTALDLQVAGWPETAGPTSKQLLEMHAEALKRDDRESRAWCELALQGHEFARVQCLRMRQRAGAPS